MPKYKLTLNQRFKSKYSINDKGCWIWNGALRKDGYGILKIKGRCEGAHRYSYIRFIGEIEAGMCVLHKCDVRNCINPFHLFKGNKSDNMQDAISKGRHRNGICITIPKTKNETI